MGADDGRLAAVSPGPERALELGEEGGACGVYGLDEGGGRPDDLELGVVDVGAQGGARVRRGDPMEWLPYVGNHESHGEDVARNHPPPPPG